MFIARETIELSFYSVGKIIEEISLLEYSTFCLFCSSNDEKFSMQVGFKAFKGPAGGGGGGRRNLVLSPRSLPDSLLRF